MNIRDYNNICVLGAARSGIGAALLAKAKDFNVFVSDYGLIATENKNVLIANDVEFEENTHSFNKIIECDLIIKSPGISEKTSVMQFIRENKIKVISELEFAYHFTNSKIIAITGTNGKTTTTSLIYYMFQSQGNIEVVVAGNIGNSFAKAVLESEPDYFILEVSSFQLDDIEDFRPSTAIITNITKDHLDVYDNYQDYIESKLKITNNQNENDYLIYCRDSIDLTKNLNFNKIKSKVISYGKDENNDENQAFELNNNLILKINNKIEINMNFLEMALKGAHNRQNNMAASVVSYVHNLRKKEVQDSLNTMEKLSHRLEKYLTINDVEFINDSKSTTVNSTWYALDEMKRNTILILGGIDKGNDYSSLYNMVEEKVIAIVCLGLDNSNIINSFDKKVDIYEVKSMEEAVSKAFKLANRGDCVLLSPACSSFDLFLNYQDRGDQFKEYVKNL